MGDPVYPDEVANNATRGVEVKYMEEEENQAPVPVVIVNEARHELRRWRQAQHPCGTIAQRVIGRMDGRRYGVTFQALAATDKVWLGADSNLTQFNGVLLAGAGNTVTFTHEDEVWAVCDTTATTQPVPIAYYYEFSVPTE